MGPFPVVSRESALVAYPQATVMGLVQGVTELFPISSLGQAVILPTLFGWDSLARAQDQPESFFLAFLVGLHVATAIALLIYFRSEWRKIIAGFFRTIGTGAAERKAPWATIRTADERMAWLLVVATIPAGITGLAFEHVFRVTFSKPLFAAVFLTVNGLILLFGEVVRRRAGGRAGAGAPGAHEGTDSRGPGTLEDRRAALIGVAQVFAPIAGA